MEMFKEPTTEESPKPQDRSKPMGLGKIHSEIAKSLADTLVKPVIMCFNISLEERQPPTECPTSTVVLVHKSGDSENHSIHRAVSDICSAKTPEKFVPKMMINHPETNNLTVVGQHVLWHKRSCLINSTSFLDEATGRMERVKVYCLDCKRVVDSGHPRFLNKK